MRIAVLGGGNGSFAAAGDLALAGQEVRLWRRDAEAVAASAIAFYGLNEWALVLKPDLRPHWQFLGALPAAQRMAALTPCGLSFSQVPMKWERRFQELAWGSASRGDENRDNRVGRRLRHRHIVRCMPVGHGALARCGPELDGINGRTMLERIPVAGP